MKLKTIEIEGTTYAVVKDGMPVYVDDGKDIAFDAPHSLDKIKTLNSEAQGHREAKQTAEDKLKAFEGITDPVAAKKAIDTVAALDQKDLIEAGKVEEIKAAAIKATEDTMTAALEAKDTEIADRDKTIEGLNGSLNGELIGGNFSRSTWIDENIAIPSDLLESRFGKHFSVKDGKVQATDASGNPIYSKSKAGELASFDEAIEHLVSSYDRKDDILKGRQQQGGGAENEGRQGGGKTVKRAEFDKQSPADQQKTVAQGITIVD